MNIVVVESPAKAKTINRYLGEGYKVLASWGHVRDLPAKDGSVRPEEDFAMSWQVDAKSASRLADIARALKGASRLILATDPDREGEAISWHVLEALRQKRAVAKTPVERVVFNAITPQAVTQAMRQPRQIDMELVEAYLARRALDYLVGFTLSPVLWRKLPGARSAGRVQSVALRLVVDREMEIEAFKSQEYWTIEAVVRAGGDPFNARLFKLDGRRLGRLDLGEEVQANAAKKAVQEARFTVSAVEKAPALRNPPPPFTTSTLQQEAARKLGFSADRTMKAAQRLYEGVELAGEGVGLITYMRTDGVASAPEALEETRKVISERFGGAYLPPSPRRYQAKAKNAQEAHEAIRPTSLSRHPASLSMEGDLKRLYDLIWRRMIASQMQPARIERTTIELESGDGAIGLRARGQVVLFDGYLAAYEEGRDDEESEDAGRLPAVRQGASASIEEVAAEQSFTQPPPRYTEATLVKKMEELGIGRPSTYASILSVLRDRAYVRMEKGRFVPEDSGRLVTAFLETFFDRYVEYDFTAELERRLDLVSSGDLDWKRLLGEFWGDFRSRVGEIGELRMGEVLQALDEALGSHIFPALGDGADPRLCPTCGAGRLSLKGGKYGAFIGCSNWPECRFTRPLSAASGEGEALAEDRDLGLSPASGALIRLRSGRFGPYVEEAGEPPRRASLPKDWSAASMDLEKALRLLTLPREVGLHPENGAQILAGFGRYGPYLHHAGRYARLASTEEVFDVGLNRAVSLLAEAKSGAGRGARASAVLAELGPHPEDGEPVRILSGRYGPYVRHGAVNANLPRGADPNALPLAEALALLEARKAKGPAPSRPKRGARAAPAKGRSPRPAARPARARSKPRPKSPR
ncbi:MAG: type I DNA topoisomerase [Caulobacteraceae bacterium]